MELDLTKYGKANALASVEEEFPTNNDSCIIPHLSHPPPQLPCYHLHGFTMVHNDTVRGVVVKNDDDHSWWDVSRGQQISEDDLEKYLAGDSQVGWLFYVRSCEVPTLKLLVKRLILKRRILPKKDDLFTDASLQQILPKELLNYVGIKSANKCNSEFN